jgi:hypothetical protein
MRRAVRRPAGPDRLNWTGKRLVLPVGLRPLSPVETLDTATPRRTIVEGCRR